MSVGPQYVIFKRNSAGFTLQTADGQAWVCGEFNSKREQLRLVTCTSSVPIILGAGVSIPDAIHTALPDTADRVALLVKTLDYVNIPKKVGPEYSVLAGPSGTWVGAIYTEGEPSTLFCYSRGRGDEVHLQYCFRGVYAPLVVNYTLQRAKRELMADLRRNKSFEMGAMETESERTAKALLSELDRVGIDESSGACQQLCLKRHRRFTVT